MVNVKRAAGEIAKLSLMKYFPPDPDARAALVQIICSFADDNDRIEWLVRRALQIFNEWPGPHELRALYCSRWPAADGVGAYSAIYPASEGGGGFPRDPALPAPPEPLLTPGREEARRMLDSVRSPSMFELDRRRLMAKKGRGEE